MTVSDQFILLNFQKHCSEVRCLDIIVNKTDFYETLLDDEELIDTLLKKTEEVPEQESEENNE